MQQRCLAGALVLILGAAVPVAAQDPPAQPPAAPPQETHTPQAGIPAKAGNSGEGAEDFSALFSTLGLGGLRF